MIIDVLPGHDRRLTKQTLLSKQMGRVVTSFFKRLFSFKSKLALPPAVYELLQNSPVEIRQVPGQGRGLVATRDLEYGEELFRESPYLCVPAASKRKQVCYHCLKALPQGAVHTRSGAFCSQDCLAAAQASYWLLESQVNLSSLERYCEQHGERFPLLAARLALMTAQQAMLSQTGSLAAAETAAKERGGIGRFSTNSSNSMSSGRPLNTTSWMSSGSRQGSSIGRLSARSSLESASSGPKPQPDPSGALSFLCYANVPPPPPTPWAESHKLLLCALREACDCREDPQEGQALAEACAGLDVDWYVAVLARLHLNTFRVDAVLPMDWNNPYAAAAAAVQPDSSSGSALYLLASLFNHSCDPCVNITFPHSDGTAVFVAARHISAGEQLFVSYTDTEQEVDVRQHYLSFAYGFSCSCPRCREEIAELQRTAPPQL